VPRDADDLSHVHESLELSTGQRDRSIVRPGGTPLRSRVRLAAISTAALALLVAACNTVSGSGNVITREIDTTSFSHLEVSHGFVVKITVGSPERVIVRVDDNLVDSLDVGVSGDSLHIRLEPNTIVTDATLEADVTARSLTGLELSGGSRVTLADPIQATSLALTVSGGSLLSGSVEIDQGTLGVSGGSKARLSGSGDTVGVTASGGSNLEALELTIRTLKIEVSGASHAEVTVTDSLSAAASGASALRYAGSPDVTRSDASGASTIEQL
jgi:predicted small secreted protein